MKVSGQWWMTLYGAPGEIKEQRHGHNVVVTTGHQFLADFLASAAAAASTFTMRYVAIGSDSTAEAASNTALGTELARVSATVSAATAIYRLTATYASGIGTGNIYEYGVFSTITSGAGTMFSRDVEGLITKSANDQLVVTTEITIS
jgi:hypothetical protein